MKTPRQIIVSLVLAASLLVAPLAVAQPHTPSLGGFDIAEFVSELAREITSIFAPATGASDPVGAQSDGDSEASGNGPDSAASDEAPDGATTGYDPVG